MTTSAASLSACAARRAPTLVIVTQLLMMMLLLLAVAPLAAAEPGGDERTFQFAERLYRDGLFELAYEQFARFAAEHPGSPHEGEAMLLGADCLIQVDRLDDALATYERLEKRFRKQPTGCEAAFKRATILVELERPREALRAFDGLRGTYGDCKRRFDAEIGAAEVLIDLGRPDEALARLVELPGDPERPGMLARTAYARARALAAAGESGNALAAYDAVVQLFPSTVWEDRSHLARAGLLAGEGDHAAALAELGLVGAHGRAEAAELQAQALALRGQLLERLGRHAEAGHSAAELADLEADDPAALERALARGAAAYERAGKPRRALELLARAPSPAVDPALGLELALDRARLARAAGREREAREALATFEALAATDTLAAEVRVLADSVRVEGLLLAVELDVAGKQTGRAVRRLRAWDRSAASPAVVARIEQRLGDLELHELDDPLAARAAYREALAAWERGGARVPVELLFGLGAAEQALEHWDAAQAAYRRVYTERPLHPRAGEARAREATVRDYLDVDLAAATAALAALAEAGARGGEPQAVLIERLADVYYETLKDYRKALALYEELLAQVPAPAAAGGEAPATETPGSEAPAPEAPAFDVPLVLYRAGRAAILAAHQRHQGKPDRDLVARGHRHFARLVAEFPAYERADDAELALLEAEYGRPDRDRRGEENLSAEAAAYQRFFGDFPDSDHRAPVLLRLGAIYRDAGVAAGGDSTSYAVARDYFATVVRESPESAEAEDAAYWRAVMAERLDQGQAAATSYAEYLRLFPRGTWATECHYRLGELALAGRELETARHHYDWILDENPEHVLAANSLARLGDCELVENHYAAAAERYQQLIARDPAGPLADQALVRLAELDERQGRWGEAEAQLRRLLADYPESPRRAEAYRRLGRLRARRGDQQGAADALARFLSTDPEPAAARAARFDRAAALEAAGAGKQALAVYEQLARDAAADSTAGDDGVRARAEAVMLLFDLDREKDARRGAESFANDFPQAARWQLEIEIARGNFLLRHDPAAAHQHFAALRERSGEQPGADRVLYGLGLVALRTQDFEAAVAALGELVTRYPGSALVGEAHFKLGSAYYAQERYVEAASHYAEARRLAPDPEVAGDAARNLGLAYEHAERYDDAIRVFRALARDYADSPRGLYGAFKIGFCYQEWGKFPQAIAAYREVLPRQSGEAAAETQFWIAESYETAGDLETAAAEYLKVGYLYPDSGMWAGTARYRAGGVYEQLGRLDDAQAVYGALAREDRGGEWGGRAAERLQLLSQDANQD